MRGKGVVLVCVAHVHGITPAYAGKSCPASSPIGVRTDHPRVCGEKLKAKAVGAMASGSPPRMRGKATAVHGSVDICGEKLLAPIAYCDAIGSPPRMRGKGRAGRVRACLPRITPAYAGKRAPVMQTPWRKRDHPRVCGEKSRLASASVELKGSPPRMRGKVAGKNHNNEQSWITPAYAGKS